MSDNYITICTEKEVENPIELSEKVLKFLQDLKYVEQQQSKCTLGPEQLGYAPADRHIDAIGYDENITRLNTNGLEIKAERQVFDAMSFTMFNEMICPNCKKNRFEGITPEKFYSEQYTAEEMKRYSSVFAQFEKWNNREETNLTCHHCQTISKLEEFEIKGNICLSNLGFTFWNWPNLKQEVIDEISKLTNSNLKVIQGHL